MIELILILPFISGPIAMHILAEKRKWSFTISDKLISGVLLGNFVLIAPSILVGFFSSYLDTLFEIYTFLSLFALALFCFHILTRKKSPSLSKIFPDSGLKIYALPILLFAFFVIFLHTLYLEYDAIDTYFPYAKSIALTGSMRYNLYDQSTLSTGMPPALPLVYAWAFSTINKLNTMGIHNDLLFHDLLRPIPTAYFLLTVLAVYLAARESLQRKYSVLSVVIFTSFPSTILTLSAFTYYLDLGFVFYLVSAVLCLTKAVKEHKPIWFFLTGVASSLSLLAKEPSFFLIPAIFSVFILFSSIRYRRVIFVIISTLPFYLVFIWDLHSFPISNIGWVILRQLPVFALSAILYFLSNAVRKALNPITWKNVILFLFPCIPSVVFFLRGVLLLDSLYSILSWDPAFINAVRLFYSVSGSPKTIDVASFFRWDTPFFSLGLGVSYLIPISFFIINLLRKKNKNVNPGNFLLVTMFLVLLETMSFWSLGSQSESRRVYYFAPMLAIFAANGLILFGNFLKRRDFLFFCMMFNSLAFCYIWVYRFPFQTILELSYIKKSLGFANIGDLAFLLLAFVGVILAVPFAQEKLRIKSLKNSRVRIQTRKRTQALRVRAVELESHRIKNLTTSEVRVHKQRRTLAFPVEQKKPWFQSLLNPRSRLRMKTRITYLSLFTLSCSMVMYPMIPLWIQGANRGFLAGQYDVWEPTYQNGILIVSYYYTNNINDHYVTVAFGGDLLMYFANRSVIDLTNEQGVLSMQNILLIEAQEDLLEALNSSSIRYFLVPRSNNTFYSLYLGFREDFFLFRFIDQDTHFQLIQEFSYYRLVGFEYP